MLDDCLRGEVTEPLGKERLARTVLALQACVETLVRLDAALRPLVDQLLSSRKQDAPLSRATTRWRCTSTGRGARRRGGVPLLCVRVALDTRHATAKEEEEGAARQRWRADDSTPQSMACLTHWVMRAAAVPSSLDWHAPFVDPGSALTISLSPSALCRANVPPALQDALSMPCLWAKCMVRLEVYAAVSGGRRTT